MLYFFCVSLLYIMFLYNIRFALRIRVCVLSIFGLFHCITEMFIGECFDNVLTTVEGDQTFSPHDYDLHISYYRHHSVYSFLFYFPPFTCYPYPPHAHHHHYHYHYDAPQHYQSIPYQAKSMPYPQQDPSYPVPHTWDARSISTPTNTEAVS